MVCGPRQLHSNVCAALADRMDQRRRRRLHFRNRPRQRRRVLSVDQSHEDALRLHAALAMPDLGRVSKGTGAAGWVGGGWIISQIITLIVYVSACIFVRKLIEMQSKFMYYLQVIRFFPSRMPRRLPMLHPPYKQSTFLCRNAKGLNCSPISIQSMVAVSFARMMSCTLATDVTPTDRRRTDCIHFDKLAASHASTRHSLLLSLTIPFSDHTCHHST